MYLESRRVELVWILEVVRAVMDVPEERHHLPPLGDKESYMPRKYKESESELIMQVEREKKECQAAPSSVT
jgi:hypothetical protein